VKLAVAMMAPLIAGIVIGRPLDGLFVAVGAFVVASTDIGGAYRARAIVLGFATLGVGGAYLVGAMTGARLWLAAPLLGLVLFASALAAALGARAAVASTMVAIAFVVGAAMPEPFTAALGYAAAIMAGGGFAMLLSLARWPLDPGQPELAAVTEAVESCSRFVAALTAVHGRPARVARQTALQRLADARRTLQEAQPGKGGTRSANRSRYLEAVLTATGDVFSAAVSAMDALSGMAIPAGDPLGARLGQVIGSAASSMRASVAVIRGRPLDEPDRLGSAVDALAAAVRAARDRASADPAQLRAFAATGRTLVELSRLAGRVTRLRRLADTTEPAGGARHGPPGPAPGRWRALTAQFRTPSMAVHHATRLAVAGAAALLAARLVDPAHGAWLVSSAVLVLKPNFGGTIQTGLQRAAATVAGALLAGAVVAATANRAVLAVIAFACVAAAMAIMARSYAWGILIVTPLSILITALLGRAGWSVAAFRVVDITIGAAIAIVVGYLLWPGSARTALAAALRAALEAQQRYLRSVSAALRGEPRLPADIHRHRSDAETRTAALAATVGQLGAEPGRRRPDTAAADTVRHLERILDATVSLDEHLGAEGRPLPEAAELADQLVDALSATKASFLSGPDDGDALAGLVASRQRLDDLVDRLVRQRARELTSYHDAEPPMDPQLQTAGLLPAELGQITDALIDLTASRQLLATIEGQGPTDGLPARHGLAPGRPAPGKEVTAMTATRQSRLGYLMILPRRAIRALRHVNEEFLRASQAIIRSARAPQATGEGARGRAA
jgi:uncharacterized membrane protein YccC